LMKNGRLGRGIVQKLSITSSSVQMGSQVPEQVCIFDLMVYLDDTPPFQAQVKKRIPQYTIAQISPGKSAVAVRVDPNDHSKIGIDLETAPPDVRMAAGQGQASAADILDNGDPCQAVIVQSQPLGMKNPKGIDMYAFVLTIMADGTAPYQIQVGNPVPPEGLPLVFPGSKVPARYMPGAQKEAVAIDWTAAVADPEGGAAQT
jgi:hypothetical protein